MTAPATFLTFQKFNDPALAAILAQKLADAGIDHILENEQPHFDPVLVANIPEPTVHLKIPASEFTRANAALEAYYQEQLKDVDPDYYLLNFTDDELLEILLKPDEWGHFDYVLAKKLLADRGHKDVQEEAERLKQGRLEDLSRPEDTSMRRSFASPFGLGGLFSSYIVATHKKTLPDGRQVYSYSPAARKRARAVFIIAAIVVVLLIILRLAQMPG